MGWSLPTPIVCWEYFQGAWCHVLPCAHSCVQHSLLAYTPSPTHFHGLETQDNITWHIYEPRNTLWQLSFWHSFQTNGFIVFALSFQLNRNLIRFLTSSNQFADGHKFGYLQCDCTISFKSTWLWPVTPWSELEFLYIGQLCCDTNFFFCTSSPEGPEKLLLPLQTSWCLRDSCSFPSNLGITKIGRCYVSFSGLFGRQYPGYIWTPYIVMTVNIRASYIVHCPQCVIGATQH
jgi:hypothetical protein